jgi:hypothetical protein
MDTLFSFVSLCSTCLCTLVLSARGTFQYWILVVDFFMQNHKLAGAIAESDHVLWLHFVIPLTANAHAVQECAVC